jgi:hypothetical protein
MAAPTAFSRRRLALCAPRACRKRITTSRDCRGTTLPVVGSHGQQDGQGAERRARSRPAKARTPRSLVRALAPERAAESRGDVKHFASVLLCNGPPAKEPSNRGYSERSPANRRRFGFGPATVVAVARRLWVALSVKSLYRSAEIPNGGSRTGNDLPGIVISRYSNRLTVCRQGTLSRHRIVSRRRHRVKSSNTCLI